MQLQYVALTNARDFSHVAMMQESFITMSLAGHPFTLRRSFAAANTFRNETKCLHEKSCTYNLRRLPAARTGI